VPITSHIEMGGASEVQGETSGKMSLVDVARKVKVSRCGLVLGKKA